MKKPSVIRLPKFTSIDMAEKCQRLSFSIENLFFEDYCFRGLTTDGFFNWSWSFLCIPAILKWKSPWTFCFGLEKPGTHCEEEFKRKRQQTASTQWPFFGLLDKGQDSRKACKKVEAFLSVLHAFQPYAAFAKARWGRLLELMRVCVCALCNLACQGRCCFCGKMIRLLEKFRSVWKNIFLAVSIH